MRLLDFHFLVRAEPRAGDFPDLKAQQVELLHVGFFVHHESGFFSFEGVATMDECAKSLAFRLQTAKSVEDGELSGGMEQRLMFVRAVHVHEPFADGGQGIEGGGRTVDELAIGAAGGKRALEHQLMVFAGFKTVVIEQRFQRRLEAGHIKNGLDRALVLPAPDEGAVGALTQDEIEGADDDGLAGAGFAGDDVAARLELQRQVGHQGKVFDAQRRQHG